MVTASLARRIPTASITVAIGPVVTGDATTLIGFTVRSGAAAWGPLPPRNAGTPYDPPPAAAARPRIVTSCQISRMMLLIAPGLIRRLRLNCSVLTGDFRQC